MLRYGENPHQVGARYAVRGESGWWETAVQHGGKEMSYLNVYDTEAAWRLAHSLGTDPTAVVIKHANPCGVAVADDITEAYIRAHNCDTVSAFGGIVAVNRPVTVAMAEALAPVFTEVLVAPGFEPDALAPPAREAQPAHPRGAAARARPTCTLRTIDGGYLVQTPDVVTVDRSQWQVVTKVAPTEEQWLDLELAWQVVAKVTSNAIVLVKDRQAFGIGCGQQNRRDAGAARLREGRRPRRRRRLRQRRVLPVRRRPRRRHRGRRRRRRRARRLHPRRRGHRRRRRRRPRHGLHRRAPLPPLTARGSARRTASRSRDRAPSDSGSSCWTWGAASAGPGEEVEADLGDELAQGVEGEADDVVVAAVDAGDEEAAGPWMA